MTLQADMMLDYPPSLAGVKKLGGVAQGFEFYAFEWLGDKPEEFSVMKLTGAIFREAKSGPRKGERVIKVPGSDRTAYVTSDEINAASADAKRLSPSIPATPDPTNNNQT